MPKCEEGSVFKPKCPYVDVVDAVYVCNTCIRYVCDRCKNLLSSRHSHKLNSDRCNGTWILITPMSSQNSPSNFKPRVVAFVDDYRYVQVSPDLIRVEQRATDLMGDPSWKIASQINIDRNTKTYTTDKLIFLLLDRLDNFLKETPVEVSRELSDAEQRFALLELDEAPEKKISEEDIPF